MCGQDFKKEGEMIRATEKDKMLDFNWRPSSHVLLLDGCLGNTLRQYRDFKNTAETRLN